MTPDMIEALGAITAMSVIGTMILIGMKMRLNARLQQSSGKGREDVEQLTDAVESLHEQVRLMRDEFADLHERVDFAERLITRGEPQAAEPEVPTPV